MAHCVSATGLRLDDLTHHILNSFFVLVTCAELMTCHKDVVDILLVFRLFAVEYIM